MTGIVAIDECGNLGKYGSRFFVMTATMTGRTRNFLQASKMITNRKYEDKYKNSSDQKITKILSALSKSKVAITYVVVDKYDFNSEFYEVYGNRLYVMVLNKLLQNVSLTSPSTEINVLIDRTSSISEKDFEALCHSMNGIRVKKCTKFNSSSSKCIQIADYVAGAIWHMYERNECKHFMIIRESIRRP